MDLGLVGRGAVAAIDLRGRCLIAGLLRTAAGGTGRALYPLSWCSGSGARGRGGDRPMGAMLDRGVVALSVRDALPISLSVDVVQRQRHAAPTTGGNKGDCQSVALVLAF